MLFEPHIDYHNCVKIINAFYAQIRAVSGADFVNSQCFFVELICFTANYFKKS